MKTIDISDIKISKMFQDSHPSEKKMGKYRKYFSKTGKQKKYIFVDKNNVLVDGYIQYLVLKENSINKVKCGKSKDRFGYQNHPTIYVYGNHPNDPDNKEYVWRLTKNKAYMSLHLNIGDMIICNTKNGQKEVKITKIELLESPPIDYYIKTVVKKCENTKE